MVSESVSGNLLPRVIVIVPVWSAAHSLPSAMARMLSDAHEVVFAGGSVEATIMVPRQVSPDEQVMRQTNTNDGNANSCGFAQAAGGIHIAIEVDGSTERREILQFVTARLADAYLTTRTPSVGSDVVEGLASA